jgi:hypothetical protein
MDGLFEEKYRISKENKELWESNKKIQMMLEEAIAENELHRRRAALGGRLHQDPGLPAANHLRPSLAADPALAAAADLWSFSPHRRQTISPRVAKGASC